MTLWVIYKYHSDENGILNKVELIEADNNEQDAARFVKLYNLQVPHDLRNKIQYSYVVSKLI